MRLTGARIIAEVLLEQGADTLFGYPGAAVLPIYDALYDYRDRLRHIVTAHEQGAAHAADGYARATGKTGVVLATSGPGATNLVTGIATAYMDSVPLVAITGNVSTGLIGKDSFQEIYITGITMPITKHNYVVRQVEELADTLRDAFRIAGSGRKGPVLVDVAKDVTLASCDFVRQTPPAAEERTCPPESQIQQAVSLLRQAKRPVLCVGGGVVASDAEQEVRQLVGRLEIPAAHTMMASGVLPSDEPLHLGLMGMHGKRSANLAFTQADVIVALGTRFSDRVAMNRRDWGGQAAIVQVDIDPSELNKNVPVALGMRGDIRAVLTRILAQFPEQISHPDWLSRIRQWRREDRIPAFSGTGLNPVFVLEQVARMAGEDAIVVTDVGQHQLWTAQYYPHCHPRRFLTSGGLGTMGFGYGAAIGAQIAYPDKRVVHITGDGSFHMNLQEACTAVSYSLPIVTILFQNQVLGMVHQWQEAFYGGRYSCTELHRQTDFVKLAEGFGARGYRADTPEAFLLVLEQAWRQNGPVWIECGIDPHYTVLPMVPAGGTVQETILS